MNAVSVIIPTRNMASTLWRAIDSACSQGPDAVYVVDDASDDDTAAVVERYTMQYAFVRYVRHPEKAACHVAALRPVYDELPDGHVIGLAADDIILPGLVTAVRRCIDAPVVFTSYTASDGERTWEVAHPFVRSVAMQPAAVEKRLQTQRPTETGIGSSVRTDVMRWLWDMGWQHLGPHSDSIGYATAAAKFGCVYLPITGAHIEFNHNGYGQRAARENTATLEAAARDFMQRAGLHSETIEVLVRNRIHGFAAQRA